MTTDLKALWQEAFGDPTEFVDGFFETGFSPDRYRCIHTDQQLACALYWFDVYQGERKFAYIYAVATAKALQGRGYCRRLLHHTHQQLIRQGYSGALLVPGDERLLAFYQRLGYSVCGSVSEFSCSAGAQNADCHCLTKAQYAAQRKKYLPRGGVVAEGPMLDFLSSFCEFWAGEDWVLAGSIRDGILYTQEFLGDPNLCPAITAALGAKTGHFRTPGTQRPFAMYYSLDESPAPTYFGLALD